MTFGGVPRRSALLLGALFVAVAFGARVAAVHPTGVLDLDAEFSIPSFASASVLLAAALATRLLARRSTNSRPALGLAILFAVMSGDELLSLHERLETASGVDWQILYAPVVLLGALAWLAHLRHWLPRSRTVAVLLVLGAAAWGGSQVLEAVEWDGNDVPVSHYYRYMVVEELGELTGSSLFLLGSLAALAGVALDRVEEQASGAAI